MSTHHRHGRVSRLFGTLLLISFLGFTFLFATGILQQTDAGRVSLTKPGFESYQYDSTFVLNCKKDAMDTPRAVAIRDEATRIGRQLEIDHGYDLTSRTTIAVRPSLDGFAGQASISGKSLEHPEFCIHLLPSLKGQTREQTIRHEWSHVAAWLNDVDAAHGPAWRTVAESMGVNTSRYSHCEDRDSDCEPDTW